jgi:hypothetical protein
LLKEGCGLASYFPVLNEQNLPFCLLLIIYGEDPRAEFREYNAKLAEWRIAILLYGTLGLTRQGWANNP